MAMRGDGHCGGVGRDKQKGHSGVTMGWDEHPMWWWWGGGTH